MTAYFPEIYKYMRAEMRPKRLIATVATISFVSICILLAAISNPADSKMSTIASGMLYTQYLVLIVYGAFCTGASIANERQERTWDFQRLTPLSSTQLAVGKLIGSSLYAMYTAGILFVWSVIAWLFDRTFDGTLFLDNLTMLSFAFASLSLGLFGSTQETMRRLGGVGRAAGIIGIVLYLYGARLIMDGSGSTKYELPAPYSFYGVELSQRSLVIFNMLAVGAWSLLGAKWRIGGELLEPARFWRLPAFLLFLSWIYIGDVLAVSAHHGTSVNPTENLMIVVLVPVILSAFFTQTRLDHLKAWLRPSNERGFLSRMNEIPAWLAGWITSIAIGLGVVAFQADAQVATIAMMLALFTGRDLAFLQWYRLGESRRPEVAVIVFLSIAYVIPGLVLSMLHLNHYQFIFLPTTKQEYPWAAQVVPALVQCVAMSSVLIARYRAQAKPAAAQ